MWTADSSLGFGAEPMRASLCACVQEGLRCSEQDLTPITETGGLESQGVLETVCYNSDPQRAYLYTEPILMPNTQTHAHTH